MGDPGEAKRWIVAAAQEHGGIDILYNNASAPRFAPLPVMTNEEWRFTLRNEIDRTFYALPGRLAAIARGGGSIIRTASIAG